nr:relaxase/mobilization nuclease domain-containing protein [uncultured Flavobacterium sp.]
MIANITQSSTLAPLLRYNNNKVRAQEAIVFYIGNLFKKDLKLAESVIAAYGNNIKSNRKDKFLHVSLNFVPADNAVLDDIMLRDIVKEYLIGIGFDEDHPYLVYKHEDTQHPHLHVITSKLDVNGKCIKADNYRQSQRVTRELEEKYNLTRVSSVKSENQTIKGRDELYKRNVCLKERINIHIKHALETLYVQNYDDFLSYLNSNHIDIQVMKISNIVADKSVVNEGLVYNVLGYGFKQNQKGIKASKLYLTPTMKNLELQFKKNIDIQTNQRMHVRKVLDSIFSKYDQVTLSDLQAILLANNIKLNFKKDYVGKLVGVSFTDTKIGLKITGESISKKYTARKIALLIGEKTMLKSVDRNYAPSTEKENKVYVIPNNGLPKQTTNEIKSEINLDKSLDDCSFEVFETQQSEAIQNDDAISDVDRKKKFNPFKRRKRRL